MGLIKKLFSLSFKSSFLILIIAVAINYLPDHLFGELKFEPQSRTFIKPQLPANLKTTEITAEQLVNLSTDKPVVEPESLKFYKNFIYTGSVDGKILKIDEKTGKVTTVTSLVEKESAKCTNNKVATLACGRPLDISISSDTLYAVDTYRGFIEYDLVKNVQVSHDLRNKIPGYLGDKTFNSIRQDPKNPNIVYLSLSSSKYNFDKIYHIFLELENSAIVVAYNKQTKKSVVIAKDITFANGIEVTNDLLIVNDLIGQRLLKYDLIEVNKFVQSNGKGNLPTGKVFKDALPGFADNLTKFGKNIVVAMVHFTDGNNALSNHLVLPNVHIRKFVYRFLYLASETLKFVQRYYKCSCLDELQKSFESGRLVMSFPFKSAVLVLDQQGNLKELIKLPVKYITHAIYNEQNQHLYLGSIVHHHISKVQIKLN